jgi:hypothetical protein
MGTLVGNRWELPDWELPDWELPDWELPDWELPDGALPGSPGLRVGSSSRPGPGETGPEVTHHRPFRKEDLEFDLRLLIEHNS